MASEDAKMTQLVSMNKMLMAQMAAMQKRMDAVAKTEAAAAPARRNTHPRTKPPAARPPTQTPDAAAASVRRSPRNHNSPAPSPRTPASEMRMRRRLSYSSAGSTSTKKKKRNTPTPAKQLVRKTLGDAIKLNCDDLLLSQHFRDKERKFKREEYKFHIKPLVDSLIADSELDTSMYSRLELFDIAVDIGKKRDAYQPKNKLSPTKKRRLRQKDLKKKAAAASAAAAAASSSSAAAVAATASPASSATASPASSAVTENSSDDDDVPVESQRDCSDATKSEGSSLREFLELDEAEQENRKKTKEDIAGRKAAAAKKKEAAAKMKEAAAAKKKEAAAAKKNNTAAAAAVKKNNIAAAKTARAQLHEDYIQKMGAAAVALSRAKSAAKKKLTAKQKKAVIDDCCLQVGMRVQGKWDDDYYDGVVVSIDYQNRTVHIKYDDDDTDDAVPWDDTRILDEFPLFG